jgi:hypothetical protein
MVHRVEPSDSTTPLLYWDVGSIGGIGPAGSRLVFSSSDGGFGWVAKDASSCQGLAESRFNLGGWDVDASNVFVVADDVLYRIPL